MGRPKGPDLQGEGTYKASSLKMLFLFTGLERTESIAELNRKFVTSKGNDDSNGKVFSVLVFCSQCVASEDNVRRARNNAEGLPRESQEYWEYWKSQGHNYRILNPEYSQPESLLHAAPD
ncbi:unnamed protein product [Enterobius vermicularis]|uniref:AIG1-type G domain-containing protein n=1 Tax=Enterobius vermicularis TaxID=51028 RepID=A0A0N4V5R8_ENTVE|nr:unnamed protein product [Enterobius vermicularis]